MNFELKDCLPAATERKVIMIGGKEVGFVDGISENQIHVHLGISLKELPGSICKCSRAQVALMQGYGGTMQGALSDLLETSRKVHQDILADLDLLEELMGEK